MREFTKPEQELINELIKNYCPGNNVRVIGVLAKSLKINFCEPVILQGCEIGVEGIHDPRWVLIGFRARDYSSFRYNLYEAILLILLLEKQGYIILSRFLENNSYGEKSNYLTPKDPETGEGLKEEKIFNDLGVDLWSILDSNFVVSNALIDLAEHKFKSIEQRRFQKLQRLTLAGVVVAIIIGVGALCKETNTSPTQIDSIQTTIRENKTTIPETINTNITNDTLKVDVVKTTPNNR